MCVVYVVMIRIHLLIYLSFKFVKHYILVQQFDALGIDLIEGEAVDDFRHA